MNLTANSHKWSILIFCNNIYPYRPWYLLFIPIKSTKSMNFRSSDHTNNNGNRLPWIRTTMRTNVILRSNRDYRSAISNPTSRKWLSNMNLRRALSFSTNPKPILLTTLPFTDGTHSTYNDPLNAITWKRIIKPKQHKNRNRQNEIPPLIFSKRSPTWDPDLNFIPANHLKHPKSSRRRWKLQPSKPSSYTSTHPTRMVLLICLRHSALHPIKNRRSGCTSSFDHDSSHPSNKKKHQNKIQPNKKNSVLAVFINRTDPNLNRSKNRRKTIRRDRTNLHNCILYIS